MREILNKLALAAAGLALLAGCTGAPAPTGQGLTATDAASPATAAATVTAVAPTEAAPATETGAPDAAVTDTATAAANATATAAPTETNEPTASPEAAATDAPTQTATEAATAAAPAIACTPGELTPAQTEGPYYTENPPETASLVEPDMGGTRITISGYVLDAQCQPVPGARVDFWQADSEGQYDNQGYTLRGYQITDAEGRYSLETVVPGLYTGRTRHIHVKVTAPDGPTLTTQLYFPEEGANAADRIYDPRMAINIEQTTSGETGTFDFVINTQ